MTKLPLPTFKFLHITGQELAGLIQLWNRENVPIVLDVETTGLDFFTDKIISFQLCKAGNHVAFYVEGEHAHLLANLTTILVLHNFKFDWAFLLRHGVDLRKRTVAVHGQSPAGGASVRDTMLMHHLLDENRGHSLDELVQERWGDDYKTRFWAKHESFQTAPPEEQLDYACRDVVYTGLLYDDLRQALEVSGVPASLVEHTHRLALALYDTEVSGVRVDLDYLLSIGEQLKSRLGEHERRLREAAPLEVEAVELARWQKELDKRKTVRGKSRVPKPEFNWASGDDLQDLIYGELAIPPILKWSKATKRKEPTLNDAALEDLADQHPVISQLRDFRADQKTFGSFIEGTLQRHRGGRIYPSLNVNGTATGRISHSDPNLGQLPDSGGIRGIYVPDEGHKFISADYGMIEVVVAAHYSQDPALLKIIFEGASKHDITANGMGVPRKTAKTLNFAIGYGATEFKVAQILNCSHAEAKGALSKYWEVYAGEKKVIDECQALVDRGQPIVGLYGRRRHFPAVFASHWEKARVYRQAYNSLIQGSAADLTHQAYYEVHQYLECCRHGRAVVEIHDQILAQALEVRAQEALDEMCHLMVQVGVKRGLTVPLTVDPQGPMDRWED